MITRRQRLRRSMGLVRRRRMLIGASCALLGAPFTLSAQQTDRLRRVGIVMGWSENDSSMQTRLSAFKDGLRELGWSEGRNVHIDVHWTGGDASRAVSLARNSLRQRPDVILSGTTPVTAALQNQTSTIPIVFVVVADPVGSGFVRTLGRPAGNITGFVNIESSLVQKWPELLKQLAPRVDHAVVMFNPKTAPYAGPYMQTLILAARQLGMQASASEVQSPAEIEQAISQCANSPNQGLILMVDSFMAVHRGAVIAAAARYKVSTMYFASYITLEGGLISYGIEPDDLFRRAATYVDRILRGSQAAELPVQMPTKFELYVNRKTALGLGLQIPPQLLLRADRVIE